MARPRTKTELLKAAQANFDSLFGLIDSMDDKTRTTPFDFSGHAKKTEAHWSRDKNIRDVLVHLHEWHQLFLRWTRENISGNPTAFLPIPYTWKSYGELNLKFWEKHQKTKLVRATALVKKSHEAALDTIRSFSNDELFTKKHYSWTGSTSVGSYAVSATSSHYDWAIKKLKAHRRNLTNN